MKNTLTRNINYSSNFQILLSLDKFQAIVSAQSFSNGSA